MRSNAVSLPSSIQNLPNFNLPSRPRRKKEVRDPYDGLRPWSAITHGIGAVLSAVGTVALLLRSAALGSALDFWVFLIYDGAVHRQHALSLREHLGGRAHRPAEI